MAFRAKCTAEHGQVRIRHLLERLGHKVSEVSCNTTLYAELHALHPDIVFIAPSVYRTEKGRLVPAVIEVAGLRYTGSGVLALSLGANFARLYPLLSAAGVPLPSFQVLEVGQSGDSHHLRYPLLLYRSGGPEAAVVTNDQALSDLLRMVGPHEEALLVEQVGGRKVTLFALNQIPLFCVVEDEVRSLVKRICQLIDARGLVRFEFEWADTPRLVSIDVAADPLGEDLLRQASCAGWNEQQLMALVLEHAGRDGDVLRPEEVTIRPLSPTDSELAELLRIEHTSFATDAYQIEDFRNVYLKCSELSVVAEIGGQIAGYMMTRRLPDKGDVFSLAVAPAYRRRDIGEALFRYTAKRLSEWGVAKMELEVRKSNEAGTSFWTRMGFVPVCTVPCFYDDKAEAILMRKVISAS